MSCNLGGAIIFGNEIQIDCKRVSSAKFRDVGVGVKNGTFLTLLRRGVSLVVGPAAALFIVSSFVGGQAVADSGKGKISYYAGASAYGSRQMDSDLVESGVKSSDFIDYKTGVAYDLVFGAHVTQNHRLQLDLGYQQFVVRGMESGNSSGVGEGKYKSHYGLVSGFYDFPVNYYGFRPYLGLGVGYASIHPDNLSRQGTSTAFEGSDQVFIGAFRMGAVYSVNNRFKIDVGYLLITAQDPKFTASPPDKSSINSEKIEYTSHSIGVGLRYNF